MRNKLEIRLNKLVGKTFNRLTLISLTDKKSKRHRVGLFKCLCGNEKLIAISFVKGGFIKSCGCLHKKRFLPKNPKGSLIRMKFENYKRDAQRRNYEWFLNKETFSVLLFSNCFYCGIEPINQKTYKYVDEEIIIKYNGIDRLENNLGYTEDNCVSCCSFCNYAKHKMTATEFVKWIERVYNYTRQFQ